MLKQRPEVDSRKIASIGFCFGGTMALELARSGADIAATVGFHRGLGTLAPVDAKNIRGKVLVCIGADDSFVPLAERVAFEEEMREGKVDWQISVYRGAVHSLTNPAAGSSGNSEMLRYDSKADARSWAAMSALFSEIIDA